MRRRDNNQTDGVSGDVIRRQGEMFAVIQFHGDVGAVRAAVTEYIYLNGINSRPHMVVTADNLSNADHKH